MAKVWIAVIEGKQHGPLSNSELKSLADSKRLTPTDHVWKEGMTEWVPAIKIKGLFAASPLSAPVPVPSRPPSQSDVATTAKDFFGTIAGAAKRAGVRAGQAIEKATQPSAKSGPDAVAIEPAASTPKTPKASRRNLVVGAISVGGLLLSCIVCGVVIGPLKSVGGKKGSGETQSSQDTTGAQYLKSFDEHPAPIQESVKAGKRVWLLDQYRSDTLTGLEPSHKEAIYVVFGDSGMEYVVHKTHHGPWRSKTIYKKDHEIDTWERMPVGESKPGKSIRRTWEVKEESPELARLEFTEQGEFDRDPDNIMSSDKTAEIVIQWNRGGKLASWESVIVSNASTKLRGKDLSTRYEKRYKGFGKLLQSP